MKNVPYFSIWMQNYSLNNHVKSQAELELWKVCLTVEHQYSVVNRAGLKSRKTWVPMLYFLTEWPWAFHRHRPQVRGFKFPQSCPQNSLLGAIYLTALLYPQLLQEYKFQSTLVEGVSLPEISLGQWNCKFSRFFSSFHFSTHPSVFLNSLLFSSIFIFYYIILMQLSSFKPF